MIYSTPLAKSASPRSGSGTHRSESEFLAPAMTQISERVPLDPELSVVEVTGRSEFPCRPADWGRARPSPHQSAYVGKDTTLNSNLNQYRGDIGSLQTLALEQANG